MSARSPSLSQSPAPTNSRKKVSRSQRTSKRGAFSLVRFCKCAKTFFAEAGTRTCDCWIRVKSTNLGTRKCYIQSDPKKQMTFGSVALTKVSFYQNKTQDNPRLNFTIVFVKPFFYVSSFFSISEFYILFKSISSPSYSACRNKHVKILDLYPLNFILLIIFRFPGRNSEKSNHMLNTSKFLLDFLSRLLRHNHACMHAINI